MIPAFPKFKKIEWTDRAEVQHFTSGFPPYSDFNFVSMWSWNTREKMMLSQLNGNLILLFFDYVTEAPFLSFMGNKSVVDTVYELIEYSKTEYQTSTLKLIPEAVAMHLPQSQFCIVDDDDSHDYIISVPYLCSLDTVSRSNNPAGYLCQKFHQLHPNYSIQKHCIKNIEKAEYINMFERWAKIRELDHRELNEYSAFGRFIHNTDSGNYIVSIHDNGAIIGFGTYEILSPEYAICHFAKADRNYVGVYDGLFHVVGKALHEAGIRYWNFEQDLGIPGLRQAKRKYKPEFFLKKFIVAIK